MRYWVWGMDVVWEEIIIKEQGDVIICADRRADS